MERQYFDDTSYCRSFCRFSDTFVRLIRTCAQLRSPLVIFLDDLQWSDGPSLRLLEALVKDGRALPLLLIGAYRDVEVDDSHALTRLVTGLQGSEVPLLQLHLGPLKLPDTTALVAACLGLPAHDAGQGQRCAELGALVQEKTEGNPFYCLQFLRALVKDGLLQFDKHTGECRLAKKNGASSASRLPETQCCDSCWSTRLVSS